MRPFDLWMEWDFSKKKTKDKNHRKCGKGLQNVTSHNLFIKNNVSCFLDQWGSQQQDCIHVET